MRTGVTQSQNEAILAYLQTGGSLTHLDAERLFHCARLAARINDLRKTPEGREIRSQMISVPSGKKVARYWIPKLPKGQLGLFPNNNALPGAEDSICNSNTAQELLLTDRRVNLNLHPAT